MGSGRVPSIAVMSFLGSMSRVVCQVGVLTVKSVSGKQGTIQTINGAGTPSMIVVPPHADQDFALLSRD